MLLSEEWFGFHSNKINQSTNSSLFVSIVRSRGMVVPYSCRTGADAFVVHGLSFIAPASLHSKDWIDGRGRTTGILLLSDWPIPCPLLLHKRKEAQEKLCVLAALE